MYLVTYGGVPLVFIHPKKRGDYKTKLRDIYRFKNEGYKRFPSWAAAQNYIDDNFAKLFEYANDPDYDLNLWRRIKAVHHRLKIVPENNPTDIDKFPNTASKTGCRRRAKSGIARIKKAR